MTAIIFSPSTLEPSATASPKDGNYSYVRGVSSFILKVVRDALIIVNHDAFLFGNRAFEELIGTSFPLLLQDHERLFTSEESTAFFTVVRQHLAGTRTVVESIVECQHAASTPFLVRVAFHPFNDDLDNGVRKCVCIFAEPIFYKPLFDHTTALVAMLEYSEDNEDCAMLKANSVAEKFFAPHHAAEPSMGLKRLLNKDLGFAFDGTKLSILCLLQSLIFYLADNDRQFFKSISTTPYIRLFRVQNIALHGSRERHLQATITYLGRSLKGRTLFTLVAEDVSNVVHLQQQLDISKHSNSQQMHFFVKMVHELRTPLSGMLGMSTLLRNTMLSLDQNDMVKTIQTCGDSVLSLVGNILDLSNLERNNVVLQLEPFNVLDCVEDALDIISPDASAKKLVMCYLSAPLSAEVVIGDMLRLRQVLLNLLANAVKFTSEGGHIVVRVQEVAHTGFDSDASAMYQFSISDDGIGIPMGSQTKIFESFIQADASISQLFGGNGLGLAIVKSLVTLMGGTISVKSAPGEGATFAFIVPLAYTRTTSSKLIPPTPDALKGKSAAVQVSDATRSEALRALVVQCGLQIVMPAEADVVICDEREFSNLAITSKATSRHIERIVLNDQDAEGGPGVQLLRQPVRRRRLVQCLCRALRVEAQPAVSSPLEERDSKRHRGIARKISIDLERRFLIVDDNVIGRRVTQKLIESMGYPSSCFYTASNGVEAIESLRQQLVDMDVEMPVMDGVTATLEIRKIWGKNVRIVACTATDTNEQKAACFAAGMDDFLTKPASYDLLRKIVRTLE